MRWFDWFHLCVGRFAIIPAEPPRGNHQFTNASFCCSNTIYAVPDYWQNLTQVNSMCSHFMSIGKKPDLNCNLSVGAIEGFKHMFRYPGTWPRKSVLTDWIKMTSDLMRPNKHENNWFYIMETSSRALYTAPFVASFGWIRPNKTTRWCKCT